MDFIIMPSSQCHCSNHRLFTRFWF